MSDGDDYDDPIALQKKSSIRSFDLIPKGWGPRMSSDFVNMAAIKPGPDDADAQADANFLIIFLSPQRRREVGIASSRTQIFDAPSGSIEIIPANASYYSRWHHPLDAMLLSLGTTELSQIAEREFDAGKVELQPVRPGTIDKTAARISTVMRDELRNSHSFSTIFLDSLSTALFSHVLRNHSSLHEGAKNRQWRGGLTPRIWHDLDAFIRENLASDMTLAALAGRVGFSYGHFLRAFRQTVGVSPHQYIMKLRAEKALHLASSTSLPFKKIALLCGFSSQSHMTTVMKSLLHTTPGEIRRMRDGD